jgi:uncharacterized protein YndB with AHSA1/START domain
METTTEKTTITVHATVQAPLSKVWNAWTAPEHITKWCQASDEWHAPYADNDVRNGGKFKTTMAAKDGSFSFDFEGVYDNVEQNRKLEYTITDGRKVSIAFKDNGSSTEITEAFEAESTNPLEMQRAGWQAILDNFKKYTESI